MYMSNRMGAWQIGNDPTQGAVEFKVFFPDRASDPSQYEQAQNRPTYGDPQIASIQVIGDFQTQLGSHRGTCDCSEVEIHPRSEGDSVGLSDDPDVTGRFLSI